MSGKPPQAAEIDWHGDLQKYLALESEVIQITIETLRIWEKHGIRQAGFGPR